MEPEFDTYFSIPKISLPDTGRKVILTLYKTTNVGLQLCIGHFNFLCQENLNRCTKHTNQMYKNSTHQHLSLNFSCCISWFSYESEVSYTNSTKWIWNTMRNVYIGFVIFVNDLFNLQLDFRSWSMCLKYFFYRFTIFFINEILTTSLGFISIRISLHQNQWSLTQPNKRYLAPYRITRNFESLQLTDVNL